MKKIPRIPSLSHQKGGKGQTHTSKNWETIGKREKLGCNLGLILSHENPETPAIF
jgi:hypothetical protein